MAEIRDWAEKTGQRLTELATTVDPSVTHTIDFPVEGPHFGKPFQYYNWTVLLQALHHGGEHRTHVKVLANPCSVLNTRTYPPGPIWRCCKDMLKPLRTIFFVLALFSTSLLFSVSGNSEEWVTWLLIRDAPILAIVLAVCATLFWIGFYRINRRLRST